jgi:hypothetical protein
VSRAHPFWTLVWIRAAFWLGTALALLWAPASGAAVAPTRAWDPFTDLVFGTFDHWDAQWFLRIAREGYDETSAAFFPLYPALLSLLGSSIVWGTLLSLVAAGLGAWAVFVIAKRKLGAAGAHDTVLILALFPTAFVFTALYSDGLFLALSASSFLAAERGRPWLAGIAGALAVGTRSMGLALLPALLYLLWPRPRLGEHSLYAVVHRAHEAGPDDVHGQGAGLRAAVDVRPHALRAAEGDGRQDQGLLRHLALLSGERGRPAKQTGRTPESVHPVNFRANRPITRRSRP